MVNDIEDDSDNIQLLPFLLVTIMSLHKEVAVVSGSSRGLGLAIAETLQSEGCHVVVNYIHSKSLAEEAASRLNTIAVQADVTDPDAVKHLFQQARERFGRPVSIVVNNALSDFQFNGEERKKIEEIQWRDFDQQLRTTVQGALNTTQAAIPGFKELHGGRIINIGTNLFHNPVVPYQDYTTAKGALLAFTRTIAAELGPLNITSNMVAGGLLRITDASAATPPQVFDQVAAITPLRRVASPADVAGAVLFLAGPHASCVTGQEIVVDGGLCMS